MAMRSSSSPPSAWNPLLAFCRRTVKESIAKEDRDLHFADFHCHTVYSDGISTPEGMAQEAKLRGLQVLAVTDHLNSDEDVFTPKCQHYFERCSKIEIDGFLVVPGVEVSSLDGDVVCLLPSFQVSRDTSISGGKSAEETIELIHGAGGMAVAAHPFKKRGVGRKTAKLKFDGMEVWNSVLEEYARNLGLASVGSSDAHTRLGLGASYTCLDNVSIELGNISVDGVLEALRRRRSFVRTSKNGSILRRIDEARWFRPDYLVGALSKRITSVNF